LWGISARTAIRRAAAEAVSLEFEEYGADGTLIASTSAALEDERQTTRDN
jgi:hypothetical protein